MQDNKEGYIDEEAVEVSTSATLQDPPANEAAVISHDAVPQPPEAPENVKVEAPTSPTHSFIQAEGGRIRLVDHFSLGNPSSSVRYRNKHVVLYGLDNDDQVVLEETTQEANNGKDEKIITVKRYHTGSSGMRFLRVIYSLVSLLLLGFLLAFCLEIIVFLFLNMASNGSGAINAAHLCAVIASVPINLYSMASILAMGTTFVQDTWKGNQLFQQLLGFSNDIVMESICAVLFLIIPGCTAAITLLASLADWWEITARVWVICVLAFMAVFALLVVVNEVKACLTLMRLGYPDASTFELIRYAILTNQTMFYSGVTRHQYLQRGNDENGEKQVLKSQTSLYSRMTKFGCTRSLFTTLNPPVRIYSADEVRDVLPFYTARNWSLERMFCRNPDKAAIFVQKGPGALRPEQVRCSLVFSIVGSILVILLVAGILAWFDAPLLFVVLFPLLVFLCCILPVILSTIRLYRMYHKPNQIGPMVEGAENEDGDGAIFQVWERTRISEPKPGLCWTMFGLGGIVGFLWPMISFFANGEYTTGTFFTILAAFSVPRLYLNPVPILRQKGPLDDIRFPTSLHPPMDPMSPMSRRISNLLYDGFETREETILRKKAKLSALVGRVNNRAMISRWMYVFGALMLLVGLFSLAAFNEGVDGFDYKVKVPEDEPFFAHGFYYPPQPKLPYPTCKIAKHFSLLEHGAESKMIDIAYLAVMGFAGPDESARLLAEWFGENQVVDESEYVAEYRSEVGRTTGISYKLFSFPQNPGVGLVSIRGSESLLDWVVDVQLWLGAALAQMIRAVIPLGWIWTPILDDLVYLVNSVESDNLKKVSYYTTTTKFVNDILSGNYGDGSYASLRVTGASLGGGLAIITGAQTNTTTVAISGLNAMLSRRTFKPPVSKDALDTHVFNVIPDRDPIAHVDDPGRLIQRTECRAPENSFFGCHSMWRSVCEFSYQCGSMGRPVLCWCVSKYGYPEPIQNGTISFAEACSPEPDSGSR